MEINLKFVDKVEIKEPQEVIVTFLEASTEDDNLKHELLHVAIHGRAFDFLHDEDEIYSDSDLKIKFK